MILFCALTKYNGNGYGRNVSKLLQEEKSRNDEHKYSSLLSKDAKRQKKLNLRVIRKKCNRIIKSLNRKIIKIWGRSALEVWK